MATAGYSGTPLPQKLGLKDGQAVGFVRLPPSQNGLKSACEFASVALLDWPGLSGVRDLDVLHIFEDRRAMLEDHAENLIGAIRRDGVIWISWPKKSSKIPTDITEDVLRQIFLPTGLVDIKVCAVDEIWSGLKFMIRKELR